MLVALSLALATVQPAAAQSTIYFDRGDMDDGTNDENEIDTPLFDATGMAPLYIDAIAPGYDPEALMFRKGGNSSARVGSGPEYAGARQLAEDVLNGR
jgi:hypothetical protein